MLKTFLLNKFCLLSLQISDKKENIFQLVFDTFVFDERHNPLWETSNWRPNVLKLFKGVGIEDYLNKTKCST